MQCVHLCVSDRSSATHCIRVRRPTTCERRLPASVRRLRSRRSAITHSTRRPRRKRKAWWERTLSWTQSGSRYRSMTWSTARWPTGFTMSLTFFHRSAMHAGLERQELKPWSWNLDFSTFCFIIIFIYWSTVVAYDTHPVTPVEVITGALAYLLQAWQLLWSCHLSSAECKGKCIWMELPQFIYSRQVYNLIQTYYTCRFTCAQRCESRQKTIQMQQSFILTNMATPWLLGQTPKMAF